MDMKLTFSGWRRLFDASWRSFTSQLQGILQNLLKSRDLIDREAASFEILEAKECRIRLLKDIDHHQHQIKDQQLRQVFIWLDLAGYDREQEESVERFLRLKEDGTCNTLFRHLCAQMLRAKPDLVPYVYHECVRLGTTASLKKTREILKQLFLSSGTVFLIIDGLDEYETSDQKRVLDELSHMIKARPDTNEDEPQPRLKLMLCSRETKDLVRDVPRKLKKPMIVSLSGEHEKISADIARFTRASLMELRGRFEDADVDKVGDTIVQKADGMFLWARLVLATVLEQESIRGLQSVVDRLPKGLNGVYPDENQQLNARRILGFMAFAFRPLKFFEVCDGLVFQDDHGVLDEETRLGKGILDICKPLIEEQASGLMYLTHFSVK
ncbi:MAG: hypothetical protein Q9227_002246, partial [Pyrenula ochraceoflavens]